MKTQLKVFAIKDPNELEAVVNTWLQNQDNIIVQGVNLLPAVKDNKHVLLVIVMFQSDEWRGNTS